MLVCSSYSAYNKFDSNGTRQAHIGDILSLDVKYLSQLPQPVASWGTQKPHEYVLAAFRQRRSLP